MVTLKDVCRKITDGSHNPPAGVEHSEYLMISSKNIENDAITFDSPRFLSKEDFFSENKRTYIEEDDLLLTIVGAIGRVAVVSKKHVPICVQRSVAVLKLDKSKVLPRYVMYHLQAKKSFLEQEARGVAQKGIYLKQVEQLLLEVVSLEQQKEIVLRLDALQALIKLKSLQLSKLDQLVKSRFVEIFGDISTPKTALGRETLFIDYRGKTPQLADSGTIRMINAKSVGNGFFKYIDEFVSEQTYSEWMTRGFGKPNDILFVTEGHTFGNVCRIPNNVEKFALGQRVITIRCNQKIKNEFLCSYMQTDYFKKDIAVYKTGGTAQGIRSKDLAKILIPIPPLPLQEEFSTFVQLVDKSKSAVKQSLEKLETLKKSLMQEYFG